MKNIIFYSIKIILLILLLILSGNFTSGIIELIFKVLVILLIFLELLGLVKSIISISNNHRRISNTLFSLSVFLFAFVVLELAFIFIPRSHGVGYTKSASNWFKYYWQTNSYGFRDKEPKNDKSAIFFVGDSFTAGHGLKDTDNRFSDIVGQNLNNFESINLGINGADTKSEFNTMIEFIEKSKIKPKIVVLQYYGNDIDKVALSGGLSFSGFSPYRDLNRIFSFFIKGSHLFNYIYWVLPRDDGKPYAELLSEAYKTDSIYQKHQDDLKEFVEYTNKEKILLIAVIFPFMQNLDLSDELYNEKIKNFFESENIKYVDVSMLIRKNNITNLVVNKNDAHPSIDVNKVVADDLIRQLLKYPL
jgi:lysophospholipase L1-like esterase